MSGTARKSSRNGIIDKPSSHSVDQTVEKLKTILQAKGVTLFGVVDHSGEANKAGLELRDTKLVIFGSPQAGTPLMAAAPLAGLDLPLKVLIWADGDRTMLSYTAPATLAARYNLSDELAGRIAGITKLTDAVIEGHG